VEEMEWMSKPRLQSRKTCFSRTLKMKRNRNPLRRKSRGSRLENLSLTGKLKK
jgi:hypothetical protein